MRHHFLLSHSKLHFAQALNTIQNIAKRRILCFFIMQISYNARTNVFRFLQFVISYLIKSNHFIKPVNKICNIIFPWFAIKMVGWKCQWNKNFDLELSQCKLNPSEHLKRCFFFNFYFSFQWFLINHFERPWCTFVKWTKSAIQRN